MQDIKDPSFFIGKNGSGLISFGSGQPDLPPPKEVFEILPSFNEFRYGLIQGQPELREALDKDLKIGADNIVITNGASEGLDLCLSCLLNYKDKVLLTKPYYYSYPKLVEFHYGENIFTELEKGKLVLEDFEKKINDASVILINSPSNPTGSVQSVKALKEIEKMCNDLKKYFIFDAVYSDLVYEGEHYQPKGEYVINLNSFSKTFSMCGLRVGYLYTENKEVIEKIVGHKTHSSMNTCLTSQKMALAALSVPKKYIGDQLKIWRERRDLVYKLLLELNLELWKPEGAFYVLPKVKDATKLVNTLYYKHKIICYKGEWFGSNNRIRLSYALNIDKIEEGIKRIGSCLKEI